MTGSRIVHSYSPRKEFLRRVIVGALVLGVFALAAIGGLYAFRGLQAEQAPTVPLPERVVNVDVAPEG